MKSHKIQRLRIPGCGKDIVIKHYSITVESLTRELRYTGEHAEEREAAQWNVGRQFHQEFGEVISGCVSAGGLCADW